MKEKLEKIYIDWFVGYNCEGQSMFRDFCNFLFVKPYILNEDLNCCSTEEMMRRIERDHQGYVNRSSSVDARIESLYL